MQLMYKQNYDKIEKALLYKINLWALLILVSSMLK